MNLRKRKSNKRARTARLVERARITAILCHPAASADPCLALELALGSDLSATVAIAALQASGANSYEALGIEQPGDDAPGQLFHTLH
jgi:hypothetical protein